ncbi:6,7-dimethyl-8-ribityllumazine synthase [Roseateles terrae]|uniref:6,7-dimethyl-8-ribityllumazine synthase n=1 Tax=Roseateles terrae TaxID=431060 RepID=A0ABR6GP30_9BURK|nr:6,7-dimethyl-8-ribityllumazine synthase [Roseateles terrae]MBB3193868.1 6,7-dimethyl-8-ribityllumazine synthase [Roseateles terrae]OWQ88999.1 riboflavin synthase subunit beta [Roseateles terrae]
MNQTSVTTFQKGLSSLQQRAKDGPSAWRIAFIQSGWHADVIASARQSFQSEMAKSGVSPDAIDVFDVPGAFEIPMLAKHLALTGTYQAVVACGFVVDGGIYRHDFVAHAVIDGLMRVQLDVGIPVLSCVLTPHHFHEHERHVAFFLDHFVEKGAEVARACSQTLSLYKRLPQD